jgi:hypothetical protein
MRPHPILLLFLLVVLISSCVSREERSAKILLTEAQDAYQQGHYDESLTLIDSLHRTYPGAVEARKVALRLQQLARSGSAREDSIAMTQLAGEGSARLDSLGQHFTLTEYPDMPDENLLRYKGYDPASATPQGNFLDAFIKGNGELRLVAGTAAPKVQGVTYIRLTEAGSGTYVVSDTIPYDRALNYRFTAGGVTHERLTLSLEASERLGAFVYHTPADVAIKASFGPKGQMFTLSKSAREAIAATYDYFATYVALKNAEGQLDAATRRAAHFDEQATLTDPK